MICPQEIITQVHLPTSYLSFFLASSSLALLIKTSRKFLRTSASPTFWRMSSILFKVFLSRSSPCPRLVLGGGGTAGEIFPILNRMSCIRGSPKKLFIFSKRVGLRNWSCWIQVGWETSMKRIRFRMERG